MQLYKNESMLMGGDASNDINTADFASTRRKARLAAGQSGYEGTIEPFGHGDTMKTGLPSS